MWMCNTKYAPLLLSWLYNVDRFVDYIMDQSIECCVPCILCVIYRLKTLISFVFLSSKWQFCCHFHPSQRHLYTVQVWNCSPNTYPIPPFCLPRHNRLWSSALFKQSKENYINLMINRCICNNSHKKKKKTYRTYAVFHLPLRRDVVAGNDVTPELVTFQ